MAGDLSFLTDNQENSSCFCPGKETSSEKMEVEFEGIENKKVSCREDVRNELLELVGNCDERLPSSVFVFGCAGAGKTTVLKELVDESNSECAMLSCIEYYTSKMIYEKVIRCFYKHGTAPKCESMREFVVQLMMLDACKSYIICLDDAERLRQMEQNVFPGFLRLSEITGLNICSILITQVPLEKFYPKTDISDTIVVFFQQYTRQQVHSILLNDFDEIKNSTLRTCNITIRKENIGEYENSASIMENIDLGFYENYLNIFLKTFFRGCNDLHELRLTSRALFSNYIEPVLNGTIDYKDVAKLYRHIANSLRESLSTVYVRLENISSQNISLENSSIQFIELPYYTKFLLIASFLASYNEAKEDKRLFVKNQGKKKKSLHSIKRNAKTSDKMQTVVGPKSFTIDRLLAVFYAILDENTGLTCNLLAQISSLVNLKFLTFSSGQGNVMEGSTRLQCTVSLDNICHIGKMVGFNVRQYLCSFF